MKDFVNDVIENLDIGPTKTRIGLITFSRYPILRIALNSGYGDGRSYRTVGSRITMFAIGIGTYINPDELEAIASVPVDRYMYVVSNFNALTRSVAGITARTCNGN
ncbi:hypothetical protein MAR_022924 [Mya arenaria]|uniref:VWFA domain-containing protein n=1 Tax=Mya arenaria TaxID=6604 RepID=A0ABY7DLG5_MYAAR|nr:hypothetical protein MAR_022924 [Mya arenaria]